MNIDTSEASAQALFNTFNWQALTNEANGHTDNSDIYGIERRGDSYYKLILCQPEPRSSQCHRSQFWPVPISRPEAQQYIRAAFCAGNFADHIELSGGDWRQYFNVPLLPLSAGDLSEMEPVTVLTQVLAIFAPMETV